MNSPSLDATNYKRRIQKWTKRLQKQNPDLNLPIGEKVMVETMLLQDGTPIKSIRMSHGDDFNVETIPALEKEDQFVPYFHRELQLSTGQRIIVNEIILSMGEGKQDSEIAEDFRIPLQELLQVRRAYKLLRSYKSKRERTADIISLVQPIFKTLSQDQKQQWAERLNLSISQLYRIVEKEIDSVKASIPLKPRIKKKEHFESRHYSREAEMKYCSFKDVKSGKRILNFKETNTDWLKISKKFQRSFDKTSIIVEPAQFDAMPLKDFQDLWRGFKSSPTPDKDLSKKCGFDLCRIREIRALHNCEISQSDEAFIEDLVRSIESYCLFKLFDRKQKEYSGLSAPTITSIDKICDSHRISRATLFRKIPSMSEIQKKMPECPKRTFTTIKIGERWYDMDSFLHGKLASMKYLSFPS